VEYPADLKYDSALSALLRDSGSHRRFLKRKVTRPDCIVNRSLWWSVWRMNWKRLRADIWGKEKRSLLQWSRQERKEA
jgi:hypothetical protein